MAWALDVSVQLLFVLKNPELGSPAFSLNRSLALMLNLTLFFFCKWNTAGSRSGIGRGVWESTLVRRGLISRTLRFHVLEGVNH